MTLLPLRETEVKTLLCSISMRVAAAGVTVPEEVVASAPVNSTVPKLANGTSSQVEPHSSKSSTIHSALYSQSLEEEDTVLDTVVPLVLFSIVKVPSVVLMTVAVTVTESPAEKEMPLKSSAVIGRCICQFMEYTQTGE